MSSDMSSDVKSDVEWAKKHPKKLDESIRRERAARKALRALNLNMERQDEKNNKTVNNGPKTLG